MNWIHEILAGIGAVFAWIGRRSDLNNTKEMQQRQTSQKEVDQDNEDLKTIKNANEEKLRNNIS